VGDKKIKFFHYKKKLAQPASPHTRGVDHTSTTQKITKSARRGHGRE
jgi:hypothetical protein